MEKHFKHGESLCELGVPEVGLIIGDEFEPELVGSHFHGPGNAPGLLRVQEVEVEPIESQCLLYRTLVILS